MRNLVTGWAAVVGLLVGAGSAGAVDGVIVIPVADKPFVAGEKDIIRVVPDGTPGINVQHKLTGPAKLVTFSVRDLNAPDLAAGLTRIEYAIVPTGKGKVTFVLTTVAPLSKPPTKVTKYEFEVK